MRYRYICAFSCLFQGSLIEFLNVKSIIFFTSSFSPEPAAAIKASKANKCGAFHKTKSSVSYQTLRKSQPFLAVSFDIPRDLDSLRRKWWGCDKLNLKATAMRTSLSY
jgi:hypothetical protein